MMISVSGLSSFSDSCLTLVYLALVAIDWWFLIDIIIEYPEVYSSNLQTENQNTMIIILSERLLL